MMDARVRRGVATGWVLLLSMICAVSAALAQEPPEEPSAPDWVVVGEGNCFVTVVYEEVSEAEWYEIFRSVEADGGYSYIGSSSDTEYLDVTPETDKTYYYKVKACNDFWGCSELSNPEYSDPSGKRWGLPPIVAATDDSFLDFVRITWIFPVEEGIDHRIYRAPSGGTDYTELGSTLGTCFEDLAAEPGKLYMYKVQGIWEGNPCTCLSEPDAGSRRLETPTGVNATVREYDDRVVLFWGDDVPGADAYNIWRKDAENDWAIIGTDSTSPYDDNTGCPHSVYEYQVQALVYDGGMSWRSASAYGIRGSCPTTEAPTGVSASDNQYTDKVRITWPHVPNATAYVVLRAPHGGTSYDHVLTLFYVLHPDCGGGIDYWYDDTSAQPGKLYDYKVRAQFYGCDPGTRDSEAEVGSRRLTSPTGVTATDGTFEDRILVEWDPVEYADSYTLLRSKSEGGFFTEIASSLTATSFEDVRGPCTAWYRVQAIAEAGSSEPSAADGGFRPGAVPAPEGVRASDGAYCDSVLVTWGALDWAAEYEVLRATDASGSESLGTTTSTYFVDGTVTQGDVYEYTVRAFDCGWGPGASDSGYASVSPEVPHGIEASDEEFANRIEVRWDAVDEATGYRVKRSAAPSGPWTTIADPDEPTFIDAYVEEGVHYYKVAAQNQCGWSSYSQADAGSKAEPDPQDDPERPAGECTLTTAVEPAGAGSVRGDGVYEEDSTAWVMATGSPGWRFSEWDGDGRGAGNPLPVLMTANRHVVARFVRTPLVLTVSSLPADESGGLISGGGVYAAGDEAEIRAFASKGFYFHHWEGDLHGRENPTSLRIDANKAIVAVFEPIVPQGRTDTGAFVVTGANIWPNGAPRLRVDLHPGVSLSGTDSNSNFQTFTLPYSDDILDAITDQLGFEISATLGVGANLTTTGSAKAFGDLIYGGLGTVDISYPVKTELAYEYGGNTLRLTGSVAPVEGARLRVSENRPRLRVTASLRDAGLRVDGYLNAGVATLPLTKRFGPYSATLVLFDLTNDLKNEHPFLSCVTSFPPFSGFVTLPWDAPSVREATPGEDGSLAAQLSQDLLEISVSYPDMPKLPIPLSCDSGDDLFWGHFAYTILSLVGKVNASAHQEIHFAPTFRIRYEFSSPVQVDGSLVSHVTVDSGERVDVVIPEEASGELSVTPIVLLENACHTQYSVTGAYSVAGKAGEAEITVNGRTLVPEGAYEVSMDVLKDVWDDCLTTISFESLTEFECCGRAWGVCYCYAPKWITECVGGLVKKLMTLWYNITPFETPPVTLKLGPAVDIDIPVKSIPSSVDKDSFSIGGFNEIVLDPIVVGGEGG
jgi:fibronectin type 3 domain-containing protein